MQLTNVKPLQKYHNSGYYRYSGRLNADKQTRTEIRDPVFYDRFNSAISTIVAVDLSE